MALFLPDIIEVLVFDVSFSRNADGRGYTKRCDYFVENESIQSRDCFRSNELFETVDSEVSRWMSQKNEVLQRGPNEPLKQ